MCILLSQVTVHYRSQRRPDKIKCHQDSAGIIENIARGKWKTAANLIVRHEALFSDLKTLMLLIAEDEAKQLCNPNKGFMLWGTSADDLQKFSFENLSVDLKKLSPLLFSFFDIITNHKQLSTCAAAAIALRGREPRLSAFAYYIDNILLYGGAKKATFKRLSKLGISTSHSCAIGKQKELAQGCGAGLYLLKVENEYFLNTLTDTLGTTKVTVEVAPNTSTEPCDPDLESARQSVHSLHLSGKTYGKNNTLL